MATNPRPANAANPRRVNEAADLEHRIRVFRDMLDRVPDLYRPQYVAWLDIARNAIQKVDDYDQYDTAWSAVREARHGLCLHAIPSDLVAVADELGEDLDYVLDADEKAAAKTQFKTLEADLQKLLVANRTLEPDMWPLRIGLHRLSVIAGGARQTHWHKVNLLRARLQATVAVLALVGFCVLYGLVTSPDVLGIAPSNRYLVLFVAGFGAVGGCVSTLRRRESLVGTSAAFHIELLLRALRPLLGAAAAVILYVAQVSGLVTFGAAQASSLVFTDVACLVGFCAGFSEKFFLKNLPLLVDRKSGSESDDGKIENR